MNEVQLIDKYLKRLTKKNIAFKCIELFINTKFEGGRHKKRVRKI